MEYLSEDQIRGLSTDDLMMYAQVLTLDKESGYKKSSAFFDGAVYRDTTAIVRDELMRRMLVPQEEETAE